MEDKVNARQVLAQVTHALRVYVATQAHHGMHGSVPASDESRQAWKKTVRAARQKKMEIIQASIRGDVPTPEKPKQQAPSPQPEPPAVASSESVETRMPSLAGVEKKPVGIPEAIQLAGPAPWKQIGSRPKPSRAKTPMKIGRVHPSSSDEPPLPGDEVRASASSNASREEPPPLGRPSGRNEVPAKPPAANNAGTPDFITEDESDVSQSWKIPQFALRGYDDTPDLEKHVGEMSQEEKLGFLRKCLGDCQRCPLHEGRNNIVYGDGSASARLVFVGEGPGYHEDKQGIPFVGESGQLLNKMINAMGLDRQDIYIANVVKCRPPSNRDPAPEEILKCSPFLYKQLETIDPTAIITLGRFASQCLLETQRSMGSMRGRWHDWRGIPVMPTYHPAYLLRSPNQKRNAWSDLQKVMKMLGLGG